MIIINLIILGSEILYLFLAEKLSFVCLFCYNTLSDFGLLKKIEAFHRAEKDDCKEKIIRSLAGNCSSSPKVLIFCRFTGLTKMQLT